MAGISGYATARQKVALLEIPGQWSDDGRTSTAT